MGKSTFLEAINEFFKLPTKALTIPSDCYNSKSNSIVLKAEISINKLKDFVCQIKLDKISLSA